MLSKLKFKSIQNQPQLWYWVLFFAIFIIGTLFTFYVAKAQDMEMRDSLTTYVKTIEHSIDWQPFSAALNTQPENIELADLALLEVQLKMRARLIVIAILFICSTAKKSKASSRLSFY